MVQKIIKIGSSIGVVIPKDTAHILGFEAGQDVEMTSHPENDSIAFHRISKETKNVIDPALLEWTDSFIDRNRELLERLKNE